MFHEIFILSRLLVLASSKVVSQCDSKKLPVRNIPFILKIKFQPQKGIDEEKQFWDCTDDNYSFGTECQLQCKNDLITELKVQNIFQSDELQKLF